MRILAPLAVALVAAAPLSAQTVTTIGGTTSAPNRANVGKGNAIRIDSSVVLLSFEMFLDVPGIDTLTFYLYQHHSPSGTFNLKKSWNVNVNGTGQGAQWYSSGNILTELLCGNSYILGASWTSAVTYHYDIGTCGQAFPLGAWLSGSTITPPPPPTEFVACDRAMYNQRFTTVPMSTVACVGTGCSSSGPAPRLLASTPPQIGTTLTIELVEGAASTPAAILFVPGAALANPIPLFGCNIWLNLNLPILTIGTTLSGAGEATVPIPIPSSRILIGTRLSTQAGVLRPTMDITNAVDLTVF